jgi:GT2 family glycosyltransferase
LCEEFFMYGEDLEWCLRMRRVGWEIWFCPEAEVLHHGGRSSARKWEDEVRLRVKLDAIYKAIERHRGRPYVSALQSATLLALAVEWLAARVRNRVALGIPDLVAYHRRALWGAMWR